MKTNETVSSMSLPPNKRTAPDAASPRDLKKARTSTPGIPGKMKICAELDSSFSAYPEKLRERVEARHEKLIELVMLAFERGHSLRPRTAYQVTRRKFSHPVDKAFDYCNTREAMFPAVSLANKEALREFLVKLSPKKNGRKEKLKFIELKQPEGIEPLANPDFAHLHTPRAGEIGWGFDRHGAVSLQMTTVEGRWLRHDCIFVEQAPLEVKKVADGKVDDCCIVEGPSAVSG